MKKVNLNNVKHWAKKHEKTIKLVGGVALAAGAAGGILLGGPALLDHLKDKYPLGDEEDELREVEGKPKDFDAVVDEQVYTELAPDIMELILGEGGTIEQNYTNVDTGLERRVKVTVE